jgi:hypothetical protein
LDDIDRAWNELDDVTVELVPRRWRSWTGETLSEETGRRMSVPYDEAWISD